jgi:hypothetical protein
VASPTLSPLKTFASKDCMAMWLFVTVHRVLSH